MLGAALCAVLAAGASVSALVVGLGHDHLLGLAGLLDLNSERNLPTWFSSALLFATALLLASAAATAHPSLRAHWRILAAVFVLLSLDEMSSLHEMSNAPLRAALGAGPLFYFPWIALGMTGAGTVALSQRRLLDALPARTRWLFIASGALYVGGAVGLEALAAPVYAAWGKESGLHASLVFVEEALEMSGVLLFFLALLQHVRTSHPPLRVSLDDRQRASAGLVRLSPRAAAGLALVMVGALSAASVSAQAVHYLTDAHLPGLVRLVNLSREGNIPTWYQASALAVCAALAAAVAVAAARRSDPFRVHWAVLALLFVYLSADEASAIHELTVRPLRTTLGASGLLYYPWVIVGSAAVATGALVFRRFMRALPVRTRRSLVTAGAVFVAGALGVEAVSGMYAEMHGRDNLSYGLITSVEETLEMLGIVIVPRALLEHIRDHVGPVTLWQSADGRE